MVYESFFPFLRAVEKYLRATCSVVFPCRRFSPWHITTFRFIINKAHCQLIMYAPASYFVSPSVKVLSYF